MIAGLLVFLYLLLITPIRAGVVLGKERAFPRGAVGVMVWGIRYTVHFVGRRDETGKFYIKTTLPGKRREKERPFAAPSPKIFHFLKGIRASRWAWQMIKKGVHIQKGELHWILGGENAAAQALISGCLQAFFAFSRRFSLHLYPVFQGKSAFRFRCIVETRLGTLLAAGLLSGLYALAAGKKEDTSWIIPSET